MLSSIWNNIVDDVAASRELQAEDLKNYAAKLMINSPEDALNYGLVDRIAYEDELFELFGEYGVKRNDKSLYNNVSLSEYVAAINISPKRVSVGNTFAIDGVEKPLVAIIYAEGQIVDGNMYADGYVYGSRLAEELRQARLDENTKAVVVRVNSPGGSALASEIAWREMVLLQQSKPVVISMGDMAASGGYYISAPADYIFADRFTITGSIGVFGTLFNIEDTLKNKLGVTSDTAATSPSAGSITLLKPLTAEQRNALKESVDRIYTTFTSHVAEGRNLPIEDVLKIAEGRVWSGSNALEIGLVDEIGGFTEAVAKATELAGISKRYALYEFNAQLSPFEQWLEGMGTTATMNMGISENSIYFDEIRNFIIDNPLLITNGRIQTKLPGDVEIDF
jgi:protease-4